MSGGIDFGGLDFTGGEDYNGVRFYAMAESATLSSPVPVNKEIATSLLDGSFVTTESHGNREPSFQVWIKAPDSIALAYGEKLLFDRCARRAEFGWTPPDGWGARTVFEAFTSSLTHEFDDMLEMKELTRAYTLRLVCYPFGFSEDEIVDVAVLGAPVTPTSVVMSDGTSAAGWTSADGAVTSSGGVLVVPSHLTVPVSMYQGQDFRAHESSAFYTFSAVDFTANRYLSADLSMPGAYSVTAKAFVDGVQLNEVARVKLDANTTRYSWQCSDTSATSLQLRLNGQTQVPSGSAAPTVTMRIDNVSRSNVGPAASSSGKEALRTVRVTGSARTAGSVAIEHPTAGLGDVLLYTSKTLDTGSTPALLQWRVGGLGNTNVNSVSGYRAQAATHTFDVAASALTAGPHLLMLNGSRPSTSDIVVTTTVATVVGSTVFDTVTLPTVAVTAATTPPFVLTIGVATMPSVDLPPQSNAIVRITLTAATSFNVDELWAFHMGDDADLTYVRCGDGTPANGTVHNRLFLDAPTLGNGGTSGLYVGTAADRSDAYHPPFPAVQAWGRHLFPPPSVTMFVVTTGVGNAVVSLRHRPAWFTHAGQ